MRRTRLKDILNTGLLLLPLWLAIACNPQTREDEPSRRGVLPVTICLPAEEAQALSAYAPARRAIGDPGTTEPFCFPNHIYFILLKQDGENWLVWDTVSRVVTASDWEPKRNIGSLATTGDTIYQYTEQMQFLLSNQHFNGRVYAVASAVPLTFNRTFRSISSLDDVLSLTFDASSETVQRNLQHIYSTPYNYEVTGDYYGSFSSIARRVPRVNLMLYHVAAKVDIQWNVVDSVRLSSNPAEAVRLTYMEARHLFNGNAYCFKPMENTVAALPATGYDIANIVTPTAEGLWWEGRNYFYTIPYTVTGNAGYFPLQLCLRTNGSSDNYRPTINLRVNTASPFVPWLRVTFNLTKPLEDKSEIKTIDG